MDDHAGGVDDGRRAAVHVAAQLGRPAQRPAPPADAPARRQRGGCARRRSPCAPRRPRRRDPGPARARRRPRRSAARRSAASRAPAGLTRRRHGGSMAGAHGSRTHRVTHERRATGFEDRAQHRPSPAPVRSRSEPPPAERSGLPRALTIIETDDDLSPAASADRADLVRRVRREAGRRRAGGGAGRAPGHPLRPQLIVGLEVPDDAAAYLVAPDLAILGTVDFFPPLVDDPRAYGEIAAANALSDVFAMGGRVLFALSVAAFPEDLPARQPGGDPRGRRGQGPRGRRDAGRRPHDPRPRAQVRPGGRRRGPPGPPAAQGRRTPGRRAAADQAARDRDRRERPAPGPHGGRRPGRRPSTRCGR